jgi:serine protease Do
MTCLGLAVVLGSRLGGSAAWADAMPQDALATAENLSTAFAEVAESIGPSVVSIATVREVEGRASRPGPFDDLLRRFGDEDERRPFRQQGQGSGFIISSDGYVLTNNHVIEDADQVTVRLRDDRPYRARIVGRDPQTDIAILRIDARDLQPVRFGSSSELRVGQWVVAAGNPFGLSSSITAGIVSAKGRSGVGVANYEDFIQTDAAINPGNSGGPLVNLRGEVVGINTAIFSRTGGGMGVGFAIPVDMIKSVIESLIDDGRVVRGWLGVYIRDLDEPMSRSFGFEGTDGALVNDVPSDGPAAAAGMRAGDIITQFNGRGVTDVDRLRLDVAEIDPGTDVEVEVYRAGARRAFDVRIGELQAPQTRRVRMEEPDDETGLGMTMQTLTSRVAREMGFEDIPGGVLVLDVERFSPAARAGIQERDVILKVQDTAVRSVSDFREALDEYDLEQGVRLTVHSGGIQEFLFLKDD